MGGYIFGLLYLLQVTVLPVVHYQMHASEHCDSSRDQHSEQTHLSSCPKDKVIELVDVCENHQGSEEGHSSQDSDSCSLCLGVHEGATVSINVPFLEIEFPVVVDVIDYGKLHLSNYSSSNPPRAPPVTLS